jgi:hypothetical protein
MVASQIFGSPKYVSCLNPRRRRLFQVWRIWYQVLVSTASVIAKAQTSSETGHKQENDPFPIDCVLSSDHVRKPSGGDEWSKEILALSFCTFPLRELLFQAHVREDCRPTSYLYHQEPLTVVFSLAFRFHVLVAMALLGYDNEFGTPKLVQKGES